MFGPPTMMLPRYIIIYSHYFAPSSSSAQPGRELSLWMASPKLLWLSPPRAEVKLEKLPWGWCATPGRLCPGWLEIGPNGSWENDGKLTARECEARGTLRLLVLAVA